MAIKVQRVRYHRNGVGGIGFFTVEFTDTKYKGQRFIATVWTREDESGETQIGDHYAVLTPDDMTQCWRGDYYADQLLPAIRAAQQNGSAFTAPVIDA
jgi:hypothetical protein